MNQSPSKVNSKLKNRLKNHLFRDLFLLLRDSYTNLLLLQLSPQTLIPYSYEYVIFIKQVNALLTFKIKKFIIIVN